MERMYLQQRPKSENWASLTPRSSATVRRTEKSTDPVTGVHPVTCRL